MPGHILRARHACRPNRSPGPPHPSRRPLADRGPDAADHRRRLRRHHALRQACAAQAAHRGHRSRGGRLALLRPALPGDPQAARHHPRGAADRGVAQQRATPGRSGQRRRRRVRPERNASRRARRIDRLARQRHLRATLGVLPRQPDRRRARSEGPPHRGRSAGEWHARARGHAPERDVVLLAPTQNLLARDTLHPALAYLLLRAASEVHGAAGMLVNSGEFPSPREAGFPLSSVAARYYQAGVPFLQRYLPFWAANLVDRLWVMLVPIIAVVVPLGRLVPALYRWRVRSRVFRWYARLKQIELQLEENPGRQTLDEMLRRLEETERAVNQIPTPLAYAENLYFFREHVDVVRRRINRRLSSQSGAGLASA